MRRTDTVLYVIKRPHVVCGTQLCGRSEVGKQSVRAASYSRSASGTSGSRKSAIRRIARMATQTGYGDGSSR